MADLKCVEAFWYHDKKTGAPRFIGDGVILKDSDPAVTKSRMIYFESADVAAERNARRAAGAPDHVDRSTLPAKASA